MDREKLLEFKGELEHIATYNTEPISQEKFRQFFKELREFTINNNIEMPEIFRYTGSTMDFRRKMQSYGGYEERREEIDDAIYGLCDSIDKINFSKSSGIEKKQAIDKKDIIGELKSRKEIQTKYGTIKFNSLDIKEGGNSIVVFGKFQEEKVAVKILISNSSNKINRFLCEFANVIIKLSDLDNVAKLYFYDNVIIGSNIVDIIVMKQYNETLKYDEYFTEEEIISIFKQIIDCMEEVHKRGIIHRDIKPQNILLDDELNVVISDFGIAYYNPEIFDITGHTTSSERLANFDFSPPEQRNSKEKPEVTMDIYAIGQIVQWLVFGETHKGTNRRRLTEKFNTKRMKFLDDIVEKCLDNTPSNRFQNIEEIKSEISKYNANTRIKVATIPKENTIINTDEIKERLIDILSNICGNSEETKKFEIFDKITDEQVKEFLDNLHENLDKLQFFETVPISKFVNVNIYKAELVNKMFYEELDKLYTQVKRKAKDILPSFVEYVKGAINDNYYELPF